MSDDRTPSSSGAAPDDATSVSSTTKEGASPDAPTTSAAPASAGPPPSAARRIMGALGRALAVVVGTWTPPPWVGWIVRAAAKTGDRAATGPIGRALAFIARRRWAILGALVVVAVGTGGVLGYQAWLRARPGPPWVTLTVTAPSATPLDGRNQYRPLTVSTSISAAPLELVGKTLDDAARAHITMDPPLPGTWTWDSDRALRFAPSEDWPVAQRYTVRFADAAFSDTVRVENREVSFLSPPFTLTLLGTRLHEDPLTRKRSVIATLRPSHVVDRAALEKRVHIAQVEPRPGAIPDVEKPLGFTMKYTEHGDEIFITSDVIPIPRDDEQVHVTIDAGVVAARGGPATDAPRVGSVNVPGVFSYFKLDDVHSQWVTDERDRPRLVLLLGLTDSVTEADLEGALEIVVLPTTRPAQEGRALVHDYPWRDAAEISPRDLAAGTRLADVDVDAFAARTARRATLPLKVAPGRAIFVRLKKGLRSEGGYELPLDVERVVHVPDLSLHFAIAHDGGILALSGERTLPIVSRGLSRITGTLGRVIPSEVNHLVTQTAGDLDELHFPNRGYGYGEYEEYGDYDDSGEGEGEDEGGAHHAPVVVAPFGEENIVDTLKIDRALKLVDEAEPQYTSLDLTEHVKADGRLGAGLFFVKLSGHAPDGRSLEAHRFVLVTDLGILTKQSVDQSWDVFVQSLARGTPIGGATVQVLAKNGRALATATTDDDGHAHFKPVSGHGARQPVAFLVKQGADLSFVPFNRGERRVNLSRFDVGGVRAQSENDELTAFVFSDRGIYRPKETIQIAAIARARKLSRDVSGLLVRTRIFDAKNRVLTNEVQSLPPGGLITFSATTELSSPTGTYSATVDLLKKRKDGRLDEVRTLGSTTVRVEEFTPDTMKIKARLSSERRAGWVSPEGLTATVTLENLFGAPATDRTVRGRVVVTPESPWFPGFDGYTFHARAHRDQTFAGASDGRRSFTLELDAETTDADGQATFALDLGEAAAGLWRVAIEAEGFEPGDGRSVSTSTSTLVSPLDVVLGVKADGDLDYVKRDSERNLTFIAIDPSLQKVKKDGLSLVVHAERFVSVLVERRDGTLAYQSERRMVEVHRAPFNIGADGTVHRVDAREPGSYVLTVEDGADVLSVVDYTIAGEANVTRQLEKSAELEVKLERADYAPGDEIELSVRAPYPGAGLITIEGDRVFAHRWFSTTTTAFTERIRVPDGVAGNAYVHVSMLRDAASRDIFTRPFSTGVVPFSLSRSKETVALTIDGPTRARPGDELVVQIAADRPTRAVVFAVDEGILRVARYETPKPGAHFFQKRALQVTTWQLLDLLLPEASISQEVSASGGGDDEEMEALAGNLNPFQRQVRAPVAFWSGVVDLSTTPTEHRFKLPDDFNGSLRVMAVAAARDAIGSGDETVPVRGDLILTPSAPLFAAPGDRFTVTVGVSNQIEGAGETPTEIVVDVVPSPHVTIQGATTTTVRAAERREAKASFDVVVNDVLGGASLGFTARAKTLPKGVKAETGRGTATLSVRPAAPYLTTLVTGRVTKDTVTIPLDRVLYPHLATREIQLGAVPITVARGLYRYVDEFPYGCTEQLVSKSMAGLLLHDVSGLGVDKVKATASVRHTLGVLRYRQVESGAFGMWAANSLVRPHHAIYAAHFLLEGKERGFAIDGAVLDGALRYLGGFVTQEARTLDDARLQAYALYVLARSGKIVTKELDAAVAHARAAWPKEHVRDTFAVWAAGAYALLKKEGDAQKLLGTPAFGLGAQGSWYFSDRLSADMQLLYVVARHFPARLEALVTPEALERLLEPLKDGSYNTLSSAYSILALRAYVDARGPAQTATTGTTTVPLGAVAVGALTVEGKPAVALRELLQITPEPKGRAKGIAGGLFPITEYGVDVVGLSLENRRAEPLYYQVTHAGFDRAPPTTAIKDRIEVVREYRKDGAPVTRVNVGDEITVHVTARVVKGPGTVDDVALVDLLPAGFAVDLDRPGVVPAPGVAALAPDFVDFREDRALVFTSLDGTARSYAYAVKATTPGTLVVPPPQAMSMYDLSLRGRGASSTIEVVAP